MEVIKGKVTSRLFNFSYWTEKLQNYYIQKIGLSLFPDTLNIQLEKPYIFPLETILSAKEKCEENEFINYLPCTILEKNAFILKNSKNYSSIVSNNKKAVIELITDVKLKDELNIKAGDIVEVKIL